ncbi:ExbD/TolR family protein [Pontibacter sp. JAM-7]|uniref:ExbD/TolR family protein n=1 Tax=Pontibacter sp. JAM-7 TaxID=3366581 RepID=UPI003AF9E9BE
MLLELQTISRRRAISLTPLIDVVFILLLFFMLSSSFVQTRQINLPVASAATGEPEQITQIELQDNQGIIRIDGQRYPSQQTAQLQALINQAPASAFVLSAKADVSTQALIELLDRLHQAGAEKVSLSGVLMP